MDSSNYTIYKWEERTEFDILFRAKANQVFILRDRGFFIPSGQLKALSWTSYADYKKKRDRYLRRLERRQSKEQSIRRMLSGLYEKFDENEDLVESIFVAFITENKNRQSIKKETVDLVMLEAEEKKTRNIMLITGMSVHQDTLKNTKEGGFNFEIYSETNMCVDRSQHVLNPKITVLSSEEKKAFFQETGLSGGKIARYEGWQINRAETTEPILQHHQYPSGTLIKITRENNYTNQVAKESLYWRIVT